MLSQRMKSMASVLLCAAILISSAIACNAQDAQSTTEQGSHAEPSIGRIGVTFANKPDDKAGLKIISVTADGVAAKAGLKAFDTVIKIDGVPVAGMKMQDVHAKIRGPVGSSVKLTYIAKGMSADQAKEITLVRENIGVLAFIQPGGVGLMLSNTKAGIQITKVTRNSFADKAGIKPLDVITMVDDEPVSDMEPGEILTTLGGAIGTQVKVTYVPNGLPADQAKSAMLTRQDTKLLDRMYMESFTCPANGKFHLVKAGNGSWIRNRLEVARCEDDAGMRENIQYSLPTLKSKSPGVSEDKLPYVFKTHYSISGIVAPPDMNTIYVLAEVPAEGDPYNTPFGAKMNHDLKDSDHEGRLLIFDTSDPAKPRLLNDMFIGHEQPWDACLNGNKLFIRGIVGFEGGTENLVIFDIANPKQPVFRSMIPGKPSYFSSDSAEALLYKSGFHLFDVSDPAHPHEVDNSGTKIRDIGTQMNAHKLGWCNNGESVNSEPKHTQPMDYIPTGAEQVFHQHQLPGKENFVFATYTSKNDNIVFLASKDPASCVTTGDAVTDMVCKNEGLSILDNDLSYQYEVRLEKVSKDNATKELKLQQDWLRDARSACMVSALSKDDDKIACLKQVYNERLQRLMGMPENPSQAVYDDIEDTLNSNAKSYASAEVLREQAEKAQGPAKSEPVKALSADEQRDALGYPLSMDMTRAAETGNIDDVKKLLAQGVTIKPDDLRIAAYNGRTEMVTFLIDHGADVNYHRIGGWGVLGAAARYGDIYLVQLLVSKGAKVDAEAVGQAVEVEHLDIAKYLLDHGANINELYGVDEKYNFPGKTILMSAAAGPDFNDMNSFGMTAIRKPTASQADVVKFLLERGADVNEQNGAGETAISVATQNKHTDIVQLLLAKKTGGSANQDFTALITAIQKGQTDIVKLLLDKGAKTDHTLLTAARLGNTDIIKLLLDKGAQVDENDHLSVAQVEEKLNADPRAKPDAAQLGEQARNDQFDHKSDHKALDTLKAMAEKGDAHAQYVLGSAGGFTPDRAKWIQKAADQNNPEALFMLGQTHAAGAAYQSTHGGTKGQIKAETHEANKWFGRLLAEAQKGNAEAQFQYSLNKRDNNSIKWLQKAADQGYSNAELMLGMAYMSGKEGVNKDESEAMKWLQKAADHGNGQAQQFLSDIYAKGTNTIPKDEKKALEWHLKAIDTGIEPISMFSIVYD